MPRAALRASRRTLSFSWLLALGLMVTLGWGQDHALANLVAAAVAALVCGLLVWPMALFAYLLVADLRRPRPGVGLCSALPCNALRPKRPRYLADLIFSQTSRPL